MGIYSQSVHNEKHIPLVIIQHVNQFIIQSDTVCLYSLDHKFYEMRRKASGKTVKSHLIQCNQSTLCSLLIMGFVLSNSIQSMNCIVDIDPKKQNGGN